MPRTHIAFLIALSLVGGSALSDTTTRQLGAFPKVGSYYVLRGDFHMHTKHSDGQLTPQERVLEAWRLGYDVIAITDHGKLAAYPEARPTADSLGMLLIRALETGVAGHEHMVALGVSADYTPRNPHQWAEQLGQKTVYYQDEMSAIRKAGGLLILAHPHVGYREPFDWGVKNGIIRGIELKNGVVGKGWNTTESHGTWWYPHAVDKAIELGLAFIASSDAHAPKNSASEVTLVFAKERSAASVVEAIREARTIAWFDGMLWGREQLLGDLVRQIITVRRTGDKQYLRITNRSPLALKASIQQSGGAPMALELSPNCEVLAPASGSSNLVLIQWQNVWIGTSENLTTRHSLNQ